MKTGLFAVGLLAAGIVQAGAAEVSSVGTWGGTQAELVEGTAIDAAGNAYVAGTTFSFGTQGSIFLIKYDSQGSLVWQRRWAVEGEGDFFSETAGDVAVDASGAIYVVGTTFVPGRSTEAVLLKFDPAGNLVWQQTFGGLIQDSGESIAISADGRIHVGGTIGFDNPQAFVASFDPNGVVLWQRAWSRGGSARGTALAADNIGNVYLAGTAARLDVFGADTLLLKFDAEGTLLSQKTYTVGEFAEPLGMTVAEDGSVYVVGHIDGAASAFVLRFTADLALDWQRAIGGRGGDRANAVTVAADGTIWIAGETNTADAGDEAFVVQMSTRARVLQDNIWGGAGNDQGIDLAFGTDGILNVGANAANPPYGLRASRLRASRLRGTPADAFELPATPTGERLPANGTVTDPGPATLGGLTDAALVRIVP